MHENIEETFKTLGLTPEEIEKSKEVHNLGLQIEKKLRGGVLKMKKYKKTKRTQKIKGGSQVGTVLTLSGTIINIFYGQQMSWLYWIAFNVAWPNIVDYIDKYMDGTVLKDSEVFKICNGIAYFIPPLLLQFFMKVCKNDAVVLAADLAKVTEKLKVSEKDLANASSYYASLNNYNALTNTVHLNDAARRAAIDLAKSTSKTAADNLASLSTNPSIPLNPNGVEVVGFFRNLYNLAMTSVTSNPAATGGIVLSMAVIAFMGYYLKIRISGSKDKNLDLDKTLYMNHNRRILIMKAQLRKARNQENQIAQEEREYDSKLKEQLRNLSVGTTKEEGKEDEKKRKRQWHKFVKRGFDTNEMYQQGDFLTESKRRHSSTRKKSKKHSEPIEEIDEIDEYKP
jgi:hypothetical protein